MTNQSTTHTQSNGEQTLEPCWCRLGADALSVKAHMDHGEFGCRERGRYVYCSNCWACGPVRNTGAEAVKVWNLFRTRVSANVVAPTLDEMWEALKAECCKNPKDAKLIVFLSDEKFRKALAPFVNSTTKLVEFVERAATESETQ